MNVRIKNKTDILDNRTNKNNYVQNRIRAYAKKQIFSMETVYTVVMLVLTLFLVLLVLNMGYLSLYAGIVLLIFLAVALFGLYETLPAMVMLLLPFSSKVFKNGLTRKEKEYICQKINESVAAGSSRNFLDMTSTKEYALIEGERNISIIKWDEIVKISKTEYPYRKKYKGIYFLNLFDRNGKKYVLDIHNGKTYNPIKQMDQIILYVINNHPNIKVEISANDRELMNERNGIKCQ